MINKDFKNLSRKKSLFAPKKRSKKPLFVMVLAAVSMVSAYAYLKSPSDLSTSEVETLALMPVTEQDSIQELPIAKNALALDIAAADTEAATLLTQIIEPETVIPTTKWNSVEVKKGDTLAKIFQNQGYSASDLHYLMKSGDDIKVLKKIRPGHTIEFAQTEGQEGFESLRYPYSLSETLVINKTADKEFATEIEQKEISYQQRFATATINSSFYNAGIDAGLPDGVIMELAGVFEYDIDFALEIRKGDSFAVLYQEKFIDGEKVGYGDILSAEFTNQGDQYAAVQYTDEKGRTAYYTPEGKALRKSFLRAPLKFNYVSSNFNPKRFHPIQKRVKPHRGVDYRAATGTPVRASGDGRVVRSSYDKYNGHHVFVQHGNNIVTKYLHFSKRRVKKGERVKQGQIIGYVGNTGMSQAPHLHYEFVVNGVHRNPRTVKLPHAAPVAKKELPRFKEQTKDLISQLEFQRVEHFARLNLNPESTKLKQ
ncbi:MAG: peptidoglycan DD-metalloendopeptidase family protein [Gammaproteobacteria bacterium]|nr:peptidoglycan DD-metalloendopeptidase family protein [Gammaproteobacteria bacterium]